MTHLILNGDVAQKILTNAYAWFKDFYSNSLILLFSDMK